MAITYDGKKYDSYAEAAEATGLTYTKENMEYIGDLVVDDCVWHINETATHLLAGSASNCGFIELHRQELDDCLSLEEELHKIYEVLENWED